MNKEDQQKILEVKEFIRKYKKKLMEVNGNQVNHNKKILLEIDTEGSDKLFEEI